MRLLNKKNESPFISNNRNIRFKTVFSLWQCLFSNRLLA